jgi:para-aminobenzoate synthetase component 1
VLFSDSDDLLEQIEKTVAEEHEFNFEGEINSRFQPSEYKEEVFKIKQHIQRGNIYEATFCQDFYAENCKLNPVDAFKELNKVSPSPFATFFKFRHNYIIGATPERFLSKRGDKLISQPIKGTIRRSHDPKEDEVLVDALKQDPKEQSENVMIVDLVRNDLTRCAVPGTVYVEELFGIYSFEQVHQMISTVVCTADPNLDNPSIIQAVFPMGSMTGAPKISAMEIIEEHERTKRGVYSGAIGYFAPGGDFDFNVVIRTLLYNSENQYLSFHVGSAITFESDAEKEYEECLLKAKAIKQILSNKIFK